MGFLVVQHFGAIGGDLTMKDKVQLFEDRQVRSAWDDENEEWYFSVVDVCAIPTGSSNPKRYWRDLKRKLKQEGAGETYENIVRLRMTSADGAHRQTTVNLCSDNVSVLLNVHLTLLGLYS